MFCEINISGQTIYRPKGSNISDVDILRCCSLQQKAFLNMFSIVILAVNPIHNMQSTNLNTY